MNHQPAHARDLIFALDRALDFAHEFAHDLAHVRDLLDNLLHDLAHDHVRDLVLALDRAHDLALDLDCALDCARDLARDLTHDLTHDLDFDPDRAPDFTLTRALELERARARARDLHSASQLEAATGAGSSTPARLPRGVVALATRILPVRERPRYREEFRDELVELPRHERLGYALRLLGHAWQLRCVLTHAVRSPDGSPARRAER